MVERRGKREDDLPVLNRRHPASGERTAVPDPVHQVDQRHGWIAGPDEVSVQRMDRPVIGHGTAGGDECLAGHLPAEYPLPPLVFRAPAAEDVELDLLEVKQRHHGVQRLAHRRAPSLRIAWPTPSRKRDLFLVLRPPGDLAGDQDRNRRSLALVIPTYSSRRSSSIASTVCA